ncbi:MAG: LysR family transcriptional regulator [Verrucomicrobiota bacterium]
MTLAQFAAVREIIQTGTVIGAAQKLHLTQPAVTQQIKRRKNYSLEPSAH